MENPEEVLHSLDEFAKLKPKDIPGELNEYLLYVASTGDPVYQWSLIKCLFRQKLINVITDFYESSPIMDIPPCPNVEPFNYESMKSGLLERFDSFTSAPFTIQRVSELLTTPRKQYNRVDKFMRAVEKNIWVVSTREPGHREPVALQDTANMVNGVTPPVISTVRHCKKGKSIEERIKSGHPQLIDDDDDDEFEGQMDSTEDSIETSTQVTTEQAKEITTSVKELIDKYENGNIVNENDQNEKNVTETAKEEEEEDDDEDEEDTNTENVKITTISSLVEDEPCSSDDSSDKHSDDTEANVTETVTDENKTNKEEQEETKGELDTSCDLFTDTETKQTSTSENEDTVLVTEVLDNETAAENENVQPILEEPEEKQSEAITVDVVEKTDTDNDYTKVSEEVEKSDDSNKELVQEEDDNTREEEKEPDGEEQNESEKQGESITENELTCNKSPTTIIDSFPNDEKQQIEQETEFNKKDNYDVGLENKMDENGLTEDKITAMIVEDNEEMEVDLDPRSNSPMLQEDVVEEPMDDSDPIVS